MTATGTVVGVDLGGTKIAVALVTAGHEVLARHRVPTPAGGPHAVVDAIVEAVAAVGGAPGHVGVGAPGPIMDGVVMTAPNLPGWREPFPLADRLTDRLERPVTVGNDANVGTLGEWAAGAGRGSRFMLGVWLGTGVGGGLVLDGRPYDGAFGGGGEFGHVCVRQGGALCGCGRRGCVEAYAGRACMEQAVATAASQGHPTALLDIAREKGQGRVKSGTWAKALEQGDELATRVLGEAVDALGAAVGSAVNLLDLDRIVVGGGLTEKLGQDLADRVAAAARPYMLVPGDRRVVVAELGDDSGVVGAAALARAAAGASPAAFEG
ncbi:MAG: ROK family protein [Euzebyaceae bacterium]|nr:ROK family protein [Euzebyaceae bacterium]